ncbi:hypothetical protein, partial [Catenulispora pinisilvae]|uniref:hypothetical protein n=1 Tax=Catenulispora pinisilvae TaxID=2705253 RepID=UPI001E4BE6A9
MALRRGHTITRRAGQGQRFGFGRRGSAFQNHDAATRAAGSLRGQMCLRSRGRLSAIAGRPAFVIVIVIVISMRMPKPDPQNLHHPQH